MSTNTNLNVTRSFWAKKAGGEAQQMQLCGERVVKTMKRERSGTLSLFVPSHICCLIDVDALDPAFSTDGFDGSRRISWQWIKCNLARLARPLDGSLGGGSLDPFYPHAFIRRPAARTFDARKQFNLTDWPLVEPQENLSLLPDLSECCCNIFLTFAACDEEKACKTPVEIIFADKFSQVLEIKFADKFSQVFSGSRVRG